MIAQRHRERERETPGTLPGSAGDPRPTGATALVGAEGLRVRVRDLSPLSDSPDPQVTTPFAGPMIMITGVPTARLGSIALDCASPGALATFWAELLGGEVAFTSDAFVAVKTDPVWLAAVQVENYQAPSWPDGHVPKQMHLDLAVDDLDQSEAEAVRLGATRAADQPAPDRYRVFLDPAGHPFCLSTQIPD